MIARKSFFLVPVLLLLFALFPRPGTAELNVSIGINTPPPPPSPPVYVVPAPQPPVYVTPPPPPVYAVQEAPSVIVIPGTYIYYVPDIGVDIFFYHGSWYRSHHGQWYAGRSHNGPWAHVPPPRVPRALVSIPHDYRRVRPGHDHIPYGQLKKNWAKWEQEKHWDRHDAGRRGPHDHDDRGHDDHGRGPEARDRDHGDHRGR
jgi:hypothetical protein